MMNGEGGAWMSSLTRVLGSLVLVVAVVFGTLWFLNSTRPGLDIKCRYLNDLGACFEAVLTQPVPQVPDPFAPGGNDGGVAPPVTPDPAAVEAARVVAAQARIDGAGGSVASDISDLNDTISSLQADMKSVPGDLKSMAGDVATTLADEQQVLTEAKNGTDSGTVCGDAGTVDGDSGTVEGDEGTIEGDGGTLDGDIATVQSSVDQLRTDAADLASARASLPSYGDSGPSVSAVSTAMSAASGAIASAQKAYVADLAKAKGYVKTAAKYAAAADAACAHVP
jgi:hypothetical protein